MELKAKNNKTATCVVTAFNRTAYGIESSIPMPGSATMPPFNRTAYGIEMEEN